MDLVQIKERISRIPVDEYISEEDANFIKSLTFENWLLLTSEERDKLRILKRRYKVFFNGIRYYKMTLEDCPKGAYIIDMLTGDEV